MNKRTLEAFRDEEYLAEREFSSQYMFCSSDMESRSIQNILDLLSEKERQTFMNLHLGYTLPEGHPELRTEIASLYENTKKDNILCFAGAEEAIYTAARVLLSAQDHAIGITPCYQSLESVAKSICDVSTVELEALNGEWHLDFEKISRALRPKTRMIFINFPHNPTGYIPPKDLFFKIMEFARQHNLIVFSDEVYRGLDLNPQDRLPSASEVYENALSLGVMSKSFGFAGLRIGWLCSQNTQVLHKLGAYKHYLSICNSAPSEWLSTAILRKREQILSENRKLLQSNYSLLKDYFQRRSDLFQWISPKGGCIAYPKYLGRAKIYDVAEDLLKSKGVVILPDHIYGQTNQHFRVSFGRKNCAEALKHFSDFFEESPS